MLLFIHLPRPELSSIFKTYDCCIDIKHLLIHASKANSNALSFVKTFQYLKKYSKNSTYLSNTYSLHKLPERIAPFFVLLQLSVKYYSIVVLVTSYSNNLTRLSLFSYWKLQKKAIESLLFLYVHYLPECQIYDWCPINVLLPRTFKNMSKW